MKKAYPIEIAEGRGIEFLYPSELGNLGGLQRIFYGHYSCEADIKPNPSVRQSVIISASLADALHFKETNHRVHLFIYKGNIHVGPLVGIFTSGITPFMHKPVGERSFFFSKILSMNKKTGCIPFLFSEHQINWDEEVIRGYIVRDNQWEVREFPFPDVIYDRLPNRKTENRTVLKEVKRRFQEEFTIPWYNPGFFNKWDIYERLQDDESALPYLPESYPFQSFSTIEKMLAKYRQVYIKPVHGSLGLGIHQIIYNRNEDMYYIRFRDELKENKLQKFRSLESMFSHVFRAKKLRNLIVQQGISLLRHENRPIDFRVHTNKDINGDWQVTAIAAKVAGEGSVTTHVKNGGIIKTLDELFDEEKLAEIQYSLSYAALRLSESIEQNVEGIIAEIGFDLGIDKDGQVWMFEANSKPGRSIFSHPKLKEFEILTRKLCLDYAVFVAEQSIIGSSGNYE
ncbi:YheC/YheD family protein [Peribacillus sp. SCS-155]|uniref:YheC/YheD family endospore coat-associated protein n=1 Tax=Peribacillus sedimenti TaxID=3115297 RepID=UPI003905AAA1